MVWFSQRENELAERQTNDDAFARLIRRLTFTQRGIFNVAKSPGASAWNEPGAWDRLVTLYAPLVYYWCRKHGIADQEIPDVVQEVFHSVATGMERFRNDRPQDTFRGWLHTISRTKSMDHFRRKLNSTPATGGSDALRLLQQIPDQNTTNTGPDDANERHIYHDLFLRACDLIRTDFKANTWKAFWRVVVDGQPPKEVADELSMKPGTVRVAKSRVLQRLRQELGELPE